SFSAPGAIFSRKSAGSCAWAQLFCAWRSIQQTGKSTVDLRVDFLIAFAPGTYFTQFFA
ncbi:hypothetical protein L195_g061388, partial [Trifolium pratense]